MTQHLPPSQTLRAGDLARVWKPRHAEHGMRGRIARIDETGAIWPEGGEWRCGPFSLGGPLPRPMVSAEAEYLSRRAGDPHGYLWPE